MPDHCHRLGRLRRFGAAAVRSPVAAVAGPFVLNSSVFQWLGRRFRALLFQHPRKCRRNRSIGRSALQIDGCSVSKRFGQRERARADVCTVAGCPRARGPTSLMSAPTRAASCDRAALRTAVSRSGIAPLVPGAHGWLDRRWPRRSTNWSVKLEYLYGSRKLPHQRVHTYRPPCRRQLSVRRPGGRAVLRSSARGS